LHRQRRDPRIARNGVGTNSRWICISNQPPWVHQLIDNLSGRASTDSNAELTWKYYSTQVCLKYDLQLVGYPQEVICDPSDLTVSELYALRVSLEKGICTFKPLPAADREALQAKVNEQVENGENPYGK